MRVVYFDTETTGLPKTRESATRGPDNWPHLVSIAWIIDDDGEKTETYHVIKPKWTIPADSTAIHGITQEHATQHGSDVKTVMQEFIGLNADVLVAHNMDFDFNVILNAILWDSGIPYPKIPKLVCTMEAGRNICRIPVNYSKSKFKVPKLVELYEFTFGKRPEAQLHNSLNDTRVLVEIVESTQMFRKLIGLPEKNPVYVEDANKTKRWKVLHL